MNEEKNNEPWSDGPWIRKGRGIHGSEGMEVAVSSMLEGDGAGWTSMANARLIAVAPELVEGIEAMKDLLESCQGLPPGCFFPGVTLDHFNSLFQPLLDRARGLSL